MINITIPYKEYENRVLGNRLKEVLEFIRPEYSMVVQFSDEGRYEGVMKYLDPLMKYYIDETDRIFKHAQRKYPNISTTYHFQFLMTEREKNYLEMSLLYKKCASILSQRFFPLITSLLHACEILEKRHKETWAYNQYRDLLNYIAKYPYQVCFPEGAKQGVIRAFSDFHNGTSTELYFMALGDRYLEKERYHKAKKIFDMGKNLFKQFNTCLLYTSPSPRD